MVVPGEITSTVSAGSNALLRLGATPVTAAADVLEAYGIEPIVETAATPLEGLAAAVLEKVAEQPASIDELARSLTVSPGDVAAALIELELIGRVREGDGVYRVDITR